MQPVIVSKPVIKIIGIEVRTNNKEEFSGRGKIASQWQKFYNEDLGSKIPNQIKPDEVMAVYTDYASDFNGEYSFILGKEVGTFDAVPAGMIAKDLPATKYAKFASRKGSMPDIVIEVWQYIWSLKQREIGSDRAYCGDYEVYDSRASNPKEAQVDIFLSIKP